jgi:hypothetical protein
MRGHRRRADLDFGGQRVTKFLEQLGAKIVDRWFANLLLPGLLWLCCAVVGSQLGWSHAIDPRALEPLVHRLSSGRSTSQALLLVAGVLGASATVGLAATGVATVLRRVWTLPGRTVPAKWLRQRRRRRWDPAARIAHQLWKDTLNNVDSSSSTVGPKYRDALARRDQIGLEPPERLTWIGDRWLATGLRIRRAYGLDLTIVWPRLWIVLSEALRNDIVSAQLAYKEASATESWVIFYGGIGLFWGPALLIAAALAVVGVLQARDATTNLCELVESACDLYGPALAEQLRITCPDEVTPKIGREINARLRRKDLPAERL